MQDKLRKLYLYASNAKTIHRRSNETLTQFALKKQQNIEYLKQLLDNKVGMPSVASLLIFQQPQATTKNISQPVSEKIIHDEPTRTKKKSLLHIRSILPTSSRLLKPESDLVNENIQQQIKIRAKIEKISQKEKEKKYEKYINQYMQKIQEDRLLDNCPQESYQKLVQQACKQIKQKLQQDQKLNIIEVDKNMEDSNQQKYFLPLKPKQIKRRKIKLSAIGSHKTKVHSLDTISKYHEDSLKKFSYGQHSESNAFSNRLYMKGSQQKQCKVIAENNLYKMNLQMITKASELKKKERKRSERKFVRNLTKISFLDSTLHSKEN